MTAEQSLVGAMGCASWRSHCRLREHAALAPVAGIIWGVSRLRIEGADVLDLNEVGVTDAVLSASVAEMAGELVEKLRLPAGHPAPRDRSAMMMGAGWLMSRRRSEIASDSQGRPTD